MVHENFLYWNNHAQPMHKEKKSIWLLEKPMHQEKKTLVVGKNHTKKHLVVGKKLARQGNDKKNGQKYWNIGKLVYICIRNWILGDAY